MCASKNQDRNPCRVFFLMRLRQQRSSAMKKYVKHIGVLLLFTLTIYIFANALQSKLKELKNEVFVTLVTNDEYVVSYSEIYCSLLS